MLKKPDIDQPPERRYCFISKIKNLLAKFSKRHHRSHLDKDDDTDFIHEDIIVKNFASFSEKTAEDAMIPRADIIAVSDDISLHNLSKKIIKCAHTRTLIYKENLDNVIGFIHIKDLFEVIAKSKKFNLKKLIRKHIVVPHSMRLVDLLKQMQFYRTHIAVVVDEYGGTDGIVTIEDVIEAIVGPIDDEHDAELEDENYKILKPGLLLVNARMEIEKLEKVLSIELAKKKDEFDTIGGLVMAKVGNVPNNGDIINITDRVTVEITDSTPRTIKQLKLMVTDILELS